MKNIGAVSRGTVAPPRIVTVTRMQDGHLIDRLYDRGQLSDRQHRAATMLFSLWTLAGLGPKGASGFDPVRDSADESPEDSPVRETHWLFMLDEGLDGELGETWRDRHRKIMRMFGSKAAALIDGLMCEQHPGLAWLCTMQCGLDDLADRLGLDRDVV